MKRIPPYFEVVNQKMCVRKFFLFQFLGVPIKEYYHIVALILTVSAKVSANLRTFGHDSDTFDA